MIEVTFRVNSGFEIRIVVDPTNPDDLAYFWRRFRDLADSFGREAGHGGMMEIVSAKPWPLLQYGR